MTTSSPRVHSRQADPAFARVFLGLSGARLPIALFVVGAAVALLGSWNVSFWTDEAATISAARRSTGALWRLVQNIDAVHATYYFLIHFWGGAFGWSPFALRLPSALAAGAAVLGVWTLARALGRPEAALGAALIAIVLPRMTWMGIEARSFGLSAAVAVWATVLLATALREHTHLPHVAVDRRRAPLWIGYGALVAVGCALNIYVALLVLAHAVTVAFTVFPRRRRVASPSGSVRAALPWLASAVLGIGVASPIVLGAVRQRGQLGDNAIGAVTLIRRAIVNQWFLGETPTRVASSSDGNSAWSLAAPVLAGVAWILVALAVVTALRGSRVQGGADQNAHRQALVVLLPWLLLPTAVVAAYSLAISPLYNPRYFTFCAPAMALLMGLGLAELQRRRLRGGAVLLIVLLALPIYLSQRQETGKSGTDWASTAHWVDEKASAGDGVYFAPLNETTRARVERTTRNVEVAYPEAFGGLIDLTITRSAIRDDSLRGVSMQLGAATTRLARVDRVWVVRPTDYPAASRVADEAVFDEAGFREESRRTGPMDTVVEYER